MSESTKFDESYDLLHSSVDIRGNEGDTYHLSGDEADRFMRHRGRIELIESDGDALVYVDRWTGEKFYAGKSEPSFLVMAGIAIGMFLLLAHALIDSTMCFLMAPAMLISMTYSAFPWGLLVLAAMTAVGWVISKYVAGRIPYVRILLGLSVIMTILSAILLRFVYHEPDFYLDGILSIFNYISGLLGIFILSISFCNIMLLVGGFITRRGFVLRPAIFFHFFFLAASLILGGLCRLILNITVSMSLPPYTGAIYGFLMHLPYSPWPWFERAMDGIFFQNGNLISILIGAVLLGVLLLLYRFTGLFKSRR